MFKSDLNVYRFVKIKYSAGYIVEKHSHGFFHYFYITKGNGALEIGGINYSVSEGEFYMVPIGIEHSIMADKDCSFQTIEIKFMPSDNDIIRMLSILPYKMKEVDANIPFILHEIVIEASRKDIFYEAFINSKFTEIILITLRKTTSLNEDAKAIEHDCIKKFIPDEKNVFEKAIKFIKENIESRFDISEVASISGFSKAHFCTSFKEKYNISPRQYINNLKYKKARELILYSDLNISQIAFSLGFQSIHYFSRFFKKWEGMSPHEYMHKMKDNIFLELIDGIADNNKVKI